MWWAYRYGQVLNVVWFSGTVHWWVYTFFIGGGEAAKHTSDQGLSFSAITKTRQNRRIAETSLFLNQITEFGINANNIRKSSVLTRKKRKLTSKCDWMIDPAQRGRIAETSLFLNQITEFGINANNIRKSSVLTRKKMKLTSKCDWMIDPAQPVRVRGPHICYVAIVKTGETGSEPLGIAR